LPDSSTIREIAAVVPTLGRPESLRACLRTLAAQTIRPSVVLVVHSGDEADTRRVCEQAASESRLDVRYYRSPLRGAAFQRHLAIAATSLPLILLAEDDIEFEPDWIESLLRVLDADPSIGAVMGRMVNQPFHQPRGLWLLYRYLVAPTRAAQPGAVIGALLTNGFPDAAASPMPSEWLGGGVTLLRRDAYFSVGGFAQHYRDSSPGEDVELGYRLSRRWKILYVPAARSIHRQAETGRDSTGHYQYMSMRSRFAFCRATSALGTVGGFLHIALWAAFQTTAELSQLRHGRLPAAFLDACWGRLRGAWSCVGWDPAAERFPAVADTHANA
jgi:GT2 family glycosyltransferase